jgi:hypothetical protein
MVPLKNAFMASFFILQCCLTPRNFSS